MARHMRLDVLNTMVADGLVPVFYDADTENALAIASACLRGGARCVEFTNRGDRALDVFKEIAARRDARYPSMILGVGSICDAPTAALYIAAGADFIVSPMLDEATARLCNQRKIAYSPGCATLTEMHRAHELGVEICKMYPAQLIGGPEFVEAVLGPCPWTKIMPTGGVAPNRESISAWFQSGIVCAGMGSRLITSDIRRAKDWDALAVKVSDTLGIIADVRSAPIK